MPVPAWANYEVVNNRDTPGGPPYSLRGAITAANTTGGGSSNPVTFSPTVGGLTTILGSQIPLTSSNIVTIDTSTLSTPFTVNGIGGGWLAPYGIEYSGAQSGGVSLIGNGYLTFDHSGFINTSPSTMNLNVAGGNISFAVIGGFFNQSAGGTMNILINGGNLSTSLTYIFGSCFTNNNTGIMNLTIQSGNFSLPALSGILNNSTAPGTAMAVNISGGAR